MSPTHESIVINRPIDELFDFVANGRNDANREEAR